MHDNQKSWKEQLNANFHGQNVPYDMYFNAKTVLKIDFVQKQSKTYHPQVYVEGCKQNDAESQQCSILSDDDDDDEYFWPQKET